MLARNSGSIINLSSDAGVVGYPTWGAYGVSKAALDQLTRTWAAELEDTGVRINSVDPGDMNTAMKRRSEPDGDASQWPEPETRTPVFVYLASDQSIGVSGQRFSAAEFSPERCLDERLSHQPDYNPATIASVRPRVGGAGRRSGRLRCISALMLRLLAPHPHLFDLPIFNPAIFAVNNSRTPPALQYDEGGWPEGGVAQPAGEDMGCLAAGWTNSHRSSGDAPVFWRRSYRTDPGSQSRSTILMADAVRPLLYAVVGPDLPPG
jgi:hypothetical protein